MQFDQILGALHAPTCAATCRRSCASYGTALTGEGGAQAYNRSLRDPQPGAYRSSRGSSTTRRSARRCARPVELPRARRRGGHRPDLQPSALRRALVRDLNTTLGAFAARDDALAAAIALAAAHAAGRRPARPGRRRRRACPNVRALGRRPAPGHPLDGPDDQRRRGPSSLQWGGPSPQRTRGRRALARALREVASAADRASPAARCPSRRGGALASASCQNACDPPGPGARPCPRRLSIRPTDRLPGRPLKALSGLTGESRSGDANGQWIRVPARRAGEQHASALGNNTTLRAGDVPDPRHQPAQAKEPCRPAAAPRRAVRDPAAARPAHSRRGAAGLRPPAPSADAGRAALRPTVAGLRGRSRPRAPPLKVSDVPAPLKRSAPKRWPYSLAK